MTGGNGTCGDEGKRGGVPRGGEQHPILILFAPVGDDWRESSGLSAGYIPFGHSTSGYSHSPPLGTEGICGATGSLSLHYHCMMRRLQRRPGGRHNFRRGAAYACANTCNFLPIFTPRANLVPSECAFITLLSYISFSEDDA